MELIGLTIVGLVTGFSIGRATKREHVSPDFVFLAMITAAAYVAVRRTGTPRLDSQEIAHLQSIANGKTPL